MPKIEVEQVSCDLCGEECRNLLYEMPDLRLRQLDQTYAVVACRNCGHRYLSPRPVAAAFADLYRQDYYAGRGADDPKQRKRYQVQAQYLPDMEPGRLLDVGCAEGDWLRYIKSLGWQCFGSDVHVPSQPVSNIAFQAGQLPDQDYPDQFFDVVTAWSVMEHVGSPAAYFKTINRILKPGGRFLFMVPNGKSLWSRWAYHDDIPRHIHFFTVKTLRHYARQYNFIIDKIEHTNRIYSKPATGRGLFRRRILLGLGASWTEVLDRPQHKLLRQAGHFGSLLDRLLIHPFLEETFHLCGNMVVIFKKK